MTELTQGFAIGVAVALLLHSLVSSPACDETVVVIVVVLGVWKEADISLRLRVAADSGGRNESFRG